MKNIRIVIPGRLPGLNEVNNANRSNRYVGAKLKKETDEMLQLYIKNQCKYRFNKITISFVWYEPNRKRDFDNICSAKKFILDALVKCEVIPNDGWKQLEPIMCDEFAVDKVNPRVEFFIEGESLWEITRLQ